MKQNTLLTIITICLLQLTLVSAKTFKQLDITKFQSNQLWKLSQLYGCARYFTPSTQTDDIDWYAFIEKNIRDIIETTSEEQADSLLLDRFSILIPDLKFIGHADIDYQLAEAPFYIKANTLNRGFQKSAVSSSIVKIEDNTLQLPKYHHIQLGTNLFASYSIVVNDKEELKAQRKRQGDWKYKWEKDFYVSPYYRLTNAIITNAYIQHFYAYYEEDKLGEIWEDEMKKYFQQVASCSSYPEYLNASYMHYGHVNDGHLFVMNGYSTPESLLGKYHRIYYPQIILGMSAEGSIYVKNCPSDYSIKKGDEILAVNGRNIKDLVDEKKKYVSAATEADRIGKVLDHFIFQSFKKDSIINLKVKRGDQLQDNHSISIKKESNFLAEQGEFISPIEEGIWKINPCLESGVSYKKFSKYIEQFSKAKGLIIDLRGYPNFCILPILSHFIDSPAMVGRILTPTYFAPNHKYVDYQITESSIWGVHPATEPYQKAWEYQKPVTVRIHTPVYFLTDRNALSFGETVMELIKNYKIGTIIGEPTAGTNGDAVIPRSPSIGFIFTGYKFFNHDGSPHHGIGVLPDVECHQSISDIQNNEDTLIKKACDLILSLK